MLENDICWICVRDELFSNVDSYKGLSVKYKVSWEEIS